MYIRTNHQRVDNDNKDIHWFASNMIFSRINTTTLSNERKQVQINQLNPTEFLVNESEEIHLKDVKKALVGRLLLEKEDFSWLKGSILIHIKHRPSVCQTNFISSTGNIDQLNANKVVLGGDQLTRERLQNMKNVCHLANTPEGRFEHLHPIVVELWHVKQDLLMKAYAALYHQESLEQRSTLYHSKVVLRRADVNGNVKSNYKAHEDLLLVMFKALIFHVVLDIPNSVEMGRDKLLDEVMKTIYGERHGEDDDLLNYFTNLATWAMQIMVMNDTAKEGNLELMVLNMKENIPFFYGHSVHSKYFSECVNTILQTEYLLSPVDRVRMLEGAFVNVCGRPGRNKEADLVQENYIKNKKELIRSLGANKTEKAVQRACMAADTCFATSENFNRQLGIHRLSGRHSKKTSTKDIELLLKIYKEVKPFQYVKGRCLKKIKVGKDPRKIVNTGKSDLLEAIRKKATNLFMYQ